MAGSNQGRVALLFGGSGLVGHELLQLLLESPVYTRVISLSRQDIAISHTKLDSRIIDFQDLEGALEDVSADDVFCCLGTTIKKAGSQEEFEKVDLEYPLRIAWAMQSKAHHFLVITALGAKADSAVFYSRVKGKLEAGLRNLTYTNLSIFRPSLLSGVRKEQRFFESIGIKVATIGRPLFCGPLKKYAAIPAASVARAMISVAIALAEGRGGAGIRIVESDAMQAY